MLAYVQAIDNDQERAKFEQLYLRYRNLMFHLAQGILHNDRDAEDAVHNAFLYLVEHMDKIEDPQCPKTKGYIVTITESRAIDIYRRKNRHPQLSLEDAQLGWEPDMSQASTIARCLAQLPKRYRQVLLLKFSHGYTDRELAQLLHITPANAAKLVYRAKQKLDDICQKEGIR